MCYQFAVIWLSCLLLKVYLCHVFAFTCDTACFVCLVELCYVVLAMFRCITCCYCCSRSLVDLVFILISVIYFNESSEAPKLRRAPPPASTDNINSFSSDTGYLIVMISEPTTHSVVCCSCLLHLVSC